MVSARRLSYIIQKTHTITTKNLPLTWVIGITKNTKNSMLTF